MGERLLDWLFAALLLAAAVMLAFFSTRFGWQHDFSYAQRASLGLIVTEGTQPSDEGQRYLATPGIYPPAHIAGWKR